MHTYKVINCKIWQSKRYKTINHTVSTFRLFLEYYIEVLDNIPDNMLLHLWQHTHQHHGWSVRSWTACPSNETPPCRVCRHTWWGSCQGCCCSPLSSRPAEDPSGSWLTWRAVCPPLLCTHKATLDLSRCRLGLPKVVKIQEAKISGARCLKCIASIIL